MERSGLQSEKDAIKIRLEAKDADSAALRARVTELTDKLEKHLASMKTVLEQIDTLKTDLEVRLLFFTI